MGQGRKALLLWAAIIIAIVFLNIGIVVAIHNILGVKLFSCGGGVDVNKSENRVLDWHRPPLCLVCYIGYMY